ncbi:basic leucine zipper 4 [Amaranthus tricolor]|uniref:basic leucine zipper 4 n=1 Tax=Amaranthus tricolor TaxID=29722 RepID=UPI00258B1590|nr:basic leucine zipper 4 [Amaranthus tricolor]
MMCFEEPVHYKATSFDDLNDIISFFQDNNLQSGSSDSIQQTQFVSSSCYFNEENERKIRRMLSNRLSARRSRLRKKKHLENMRVELNRLKVLNRNLKNRLNLFTYHRYIVSKENERLCCELILLKQRLSHLYNHSLLSIDLSNNSGHQ